LLLLLLLLLLAAGDCISGLYDMIACNDSGQP